MLSARQHGFTLVETVISLVLLSFLVLIGYQGLTFGVDQWRNGHNRMHQVYTYYQALDWMRDKLGTAQLAGRIGSDANAYLFDGRQESVEFVARFERARGGGLYVVRIFLDPADSSLYSSYYLHHVDTAGAQPAPEPDRVALLEEVASIRFSYYGRQPGSKKRGWHETWPEQNSLPQLLGLEVETLKGGRHRSLLYIETSNNA